MKKLSSRGLQKEESESNPRSLNELREWIGKNHIDTSEWGFGNAKTIDDLWCEIEAGEAKLYDEPPHRLLSVTKILISRDEEILIEMEQVLQNSRIRAREIPPAEKIKIGEDYKDTIKRCLWEELSISPGDFQIVEGSHQISQEEKTSLSYPNLVTRYEYHTAKVVVKGLPQKDFWTKESTFGGISRVEKHHWGWRKNSDLI